MSGYVYPYVAYSYSGEEFEIGALDDEKAFFDRARSLFGVFRYVLVSIEPNDLTRYEFVVTESGRGIVPSFMNEPIGWCVEIGKDGFSVPGYISEKIARGHKPNPCTIAVAADLVNMLRDRGCEDRFYDWKEGRLLGDPPDPS